MSNFIEQTMFFNVSSHIVFVGDMLYRYKIGKLNYTNIVP